MSDFYRKKPVVIEARQFRVAAWRAFESWSPAITPIGNWKHPDDVLCLHIKTLEGTMTAMPGDWIIKGVKGEFYPCKPDIFDATYEKVAEEDGKDLAHSQAQIIPPVTP